MSETFTVPQRPPDYADVFTGSVADPEMTARQMLRFSLSKSPRWFVMLHNLRNKIAGMLGLKTGEGTHQGLSVSALENLPVVYETETELSSGLSDKHLDFLLTVKKSEGASPQVSITTQIWFNAAMGRIYLILVLPFHKAIIKYYIRQLGKPA